MNMCVMLINALFLQRNEKTAVKHALIKEKVVIQVLLLEASRTILRVSLMRLELKFILTLFKSVNISPELV